MRNKKTKISSLKLLLTWIQNNTVMTIWLLLCASALFNVGYFYPLSIKYISFLSASDFYAGTMVYVFLMTYITIGAWALFNFSEQNMIISTIKNWGLLFKYKRYGSLLRKAQSNDIVLTSAKRKKLNELILTRKKYEPNIHSSLKRQIANTLLIIVNCVFVFGSCYIYCGKENCILVFCIFVAFFIFDSIVKNTSALKIMKTLMIFYCIAIFGRLYLFYNVSNNSEIITTKEHEYTVIRKIESGYFVLDNCDLLFLDNDLNIKTTQKIEKGYLHKICNNKTIKSKDSPAQSEPNHHNSTNP